MRRTSRAWFTAAVVLVLAFGVARGQPVDPPPPPVPVVPGQQTPPARVVPLTPSTPIHMPETAPTLPPPSPYPYDRDPLLDRPGCPPPGWFADVDLSFLAVHVKDRLSNTVTIDNSQPDLIHVPPAVLNWAVSPRFTLGYRFPDGFGDLQLSYRFLTTDGSSVFLEPLGLAGVRSRLSVNVFDFDYASLEYSLDPFWEMKWFLGARLAGAFYDAHSFLQTAPGIFAGVNIDQETSNNFWGAGPHAGLQLTRKLGTSGLAVFGQIEGATVLGRIHQGFGEGFSFNGVPNVTFGSATLVSASQAVPMLELQLGLRYIPPGYNHVRLFMGYQFEQWWSLGLAAGSDLELTTQGIFFRTELDF